MDSKSHSYNIVFMDVSPIYIGVIPYQFSKGLDMTSLELDKTWCTSSPGGSILPVEV